MNLGPNLWDDPNYVSGTILPRAKGFDLGSVALPFKSIYLSGDLNVAGNEVLTGNQTINGNFTVTGTSTLTGMVTTGDGLAVTNNETVGGTLGVTGDTTLSGDVSIPGLLKSLRILRGEALDADVTTASPIANTLGYVASDQLGGSAWTIIANQADANPAFIRLMKTRSTTLNANTIIINGDILGQITAWGADGADYQRAAAILFTVNGTPGAADMPGAIEFWTTADNTNTLLQRWRVNAAGNLNNDATNGGSIAFTKATTGIELQSGANGRTGTFTINGATPVTVNNTSLAAGDQIIITRDTPAGTPGAFNLTTRTNGASFVVTGTASDTSGMRYSLVRIN